MTDLDVSKREKIKHLLGKDYQSIIFFGIALQDRTGRCIEKTVGLLLSNIQKNDLDILSKQHQELLELEDLAKPKTKTQKFYAFFKDASPIRDRDTIFRAIMCIASTILNKILVNKLHLEILKDELKSLIIELDEYIEVGKAVLEEDFKSSAKIHLKHRIQELETTKYIASSNICLLDDIIYSNDSLIEVLQIVEKLDDDYNSKNIIQLYKNSIINTITIMSDIKLTIENKVI